MSRWTDTFKNHPFRSQWDEIKNELESTVVDDESVSTQVEELARLNKAISYLDTLLESVDPELLPLNMWTNCEQQASQCLQQLRSYNSNRNSAHIQAANKHVDSLLTYIRPYMVLPENVAKAIESSSHAYIETVQNALEDFSEKSREVINDIQDYKDTAKEISENIQQTEKLINEYSAQLFGNEREEGIKGEIDKLLADCKEKVAEILVAHEAIVAGSSSETSFKEEIEDAATIVREKIKDIHALLASVETEISDLEKFHIKIFGKESEEGTRHGGLSNDLQLLKNELVDFEETQKTKYGALIQEIETLLPGATSAGLSSAYKDLKDSFDTPVRNASLVFYLAIFLLVVASMILAIDSVGGESWISFVEVSSWDTVLKSLVNKLPFYGPIIWLAFYASKRRSESQRLQQEYAHKEALAKSYHSYKKQIEDLNTEETELLTELITKAIHAISYNASKTLDGKHGDKLPSQEVVEKLLVELTKQAQKIDNRGVGT
jgi:prefoldin subunit 5